MENINTTIFKEILGNRRYILPFLRRKVHALQIAISSTDRKYIKYFERELRSKIYHMQQSSGKYTCAFCLNLEKSTCHALCFKCNKNYYEGCGSLLPGTYPFMTKTLDANGNEIIPWTLISACGRYENPGKQDYFKNFMYTEQNIKISYYEAMEGIYTGFCRGRRPCHLCAGVNLELYNDCLKDENYDIDKPCSKVIEAITKCYSVPSIFHFHKTVG